MYLLHKPSDCLVEVSTPSELWNPFLSKVSGRFHAGEELQEQESFSKSHLAFPSGESLPTCWLNPDYRQVLSEPAEQQLTMTV